MTEASSPLRLLLVDDHFVVRMGLASSLELEPDVTVVAEAGTGDQSIHLYREHRPDLVIMDYELPDFSGIEATTHICKEDSDARIIMLSVYEGEEDVFRAMEAGARGYLPKSVQRDELLCAIRQVYAGEEYIPPHLQEKLAARQSRSSLSQRQMQVLKCIVDGLSNKEIAADLGIAEITVKLHVTQILQKLNVEDRTQAAMAAIQRGIIHLDY